MKKSKEKLKKYSEFNESKTHPPKFMGYDSISTCRETYNYKYLYEEKDSTNNYIN